MLALLIAGALATAQGYDDYSPLEVGHTWNSRAIVVDGEKKQELATSVKIKGRKKVNDVECYVVETEAGGALSQEYLVGSEGSLRVLGGRRGDVEFTYDRPIVRLKYPLIKGKTWEDKTTQAGAEATYKTTVEGEEEIEVPAGKYKAFKVKVEMDSPVGKTEACNWYAKNVGVVKQWVKQSTLELTVELKSFVKEKK